jgi:hypothetical protein
MNDESERVERVGTVTYPVASFTLKKSHIRWLAEQATAKGTTKSGLLRDLLDKFIKSEREAA